MIQEQLITQAEKIFDSFEKWDSLFELYKMKDSIANIWWKKAQIAIRKENERNPLAGWSFTQWTFWDNAWWLSEYSENSLRIWIWGGRFHLYCDPTYFDAIKLKTLLLDPKFEILKSSFDRIDESNDQYLGIEIGNYYFESVYDGNFISDPSDTPNTNFHQLAWYAGHCTEEYVKQVFEKVNRFRTEEITALIRDINIGAKRSF